DLLRSPHQNLPKGHEVCGDEKERRYGNCKASHWSEFLHRLFFWVKEFRFTSETPSPFGSLSARVLSFNHAGRELNRYIAIGRRDPDVSGHFLVECRAKVGTVERIDTRLFWQPFQRLRFAWHNEYLRIAGTLDSETVWYVPILFQVCHMEIDFIADTHPFNIIRRQVRANCSHIHVNFLPFPFHPGLALAFRHVRMFIVFEPVELGDVFLYHAGRYCFSIVWFTCCREVEKQLHLVT